MAVAELAVETIPGCDSASITVIHDGAPDTIASSDDRALSIDDMQYSSGQGPCLHAARTDEVVEVPDLALSSPEGTWQRAAVNAGIHAVLALPIASHVNVAAALNLYTTQAIWSDSAQVKGEDLAIYTGDAITLVHRHGGDPTDPLNHAPS